MQHDIKRFGQFIQFSLGTKEVPPPDISEKEWEWFFNESVRQAIGGITFEGVKKLCPELMPDQKLFLHWKAHSIKVKHANEVMMKVAVSLTEFFEEHGFKTRILKGLTNNMLYPNPFSRTPGDIDIWVGGGKEKVLDFIRENGLEGTVSYHHFHTDGSFVGFPDVPVEIHFRPSSGNYNPRTNKKIQKFLEAEISFVGEEELPTGGKIYFTSPFFKAVMELSHIQRHFVSGGIGLRHILDYALLLYSYPVANLDTKDLKELGLYDMAQALSYVFRELLDFDCGIKPNSKTGKLLLRDIFESGNFGRYATSKDDTLITRWTKREIRSIRLARVAPSEFIWGELTIWGNIIKTIPTRIKNRRLSLNPQQ